jgi:hypothetical protein
MFLPFVYCRVAEMLMQQGRLTDAGMWLAKTEGLLARTGEVNYRGELLRLQAMFLLWQQRLHEAELLLVQAIDLARRQGARSVELRVATTYAELLAERGAAERGSTLLHTVLDGFAEGHGRHDVVAARATLAVVGPSRVERPSES